MVGWASSTEAMLVNVAWASYDMVILSVIIDAALYRGFAPDEEAIT